MTFPQHNQKHNEHGLFGPDDLVKYKGVPRGNFPSKVIITYPSTTNSLIDYFRAKYAGKAERAVFSGGEEVLRCGDIGVIGLRGIGAPHASVYLEALIACGAKEFLNVGTCGGLIRPGVFICSKAVRDEGTSHHYLPSEKWAFPDSELTERLGDSLKTNGVEFSVAPGWTTDAPYRETKTEIANYRAEGIATVDMEASALFTVAKFRGVKIASAFAVSDILGEKWDPQFHRLDLKLALRKILDCAVDCFGGIK